MDLNNQLPLHLENIETATIALGFDMPSERNTGALLRTLASTKLAANFLEIGTGTGLATAWLLDGMDERSTLTSLDKDETALSVARNHLSNDDRLTLVLDDGNDWLKRNQDHRYDLIFADSYPGKYNNFGLAWNILKSGGIYLIDDMLPQQNWPKDHEIRVKQLANDLQNRNDANLTWLDWASGLILAVKLS
ncbi:class I SAM-dependent methyltransferase [Alphaproteobacteria bacterium]|jgi:predicted O-methyltransferase YrrM|nr:class I SAM-dependent methyltransferase [Alphaproteobacteria bacterium]